MPLDFIATPELEYPVSTVVTRRVLALDDDADMLTLYALILEGAGYAVDSAPDGEAGWDLLCTNKYDLLLTDDQMPNLTGLDLVARLRGARMRLPVILCSGFGLSDKIGDGKWLGLAAVLYKPFTQEELLTAVQHTIPLRAAASASRKNTRQFATFLWTD